MIQFSRQRKKNNKKRLKVMSKQKKKEPESEPIYLPADLEYWEDQPKPKKTETSKKSKEN